MRYINVSQLVKTKIIAYIKHNGGSQLYNI